MATSTKGNVTGPGEVVAVHVPARSLRHDLRAIKIVLHREMLRFGNDRTRLLSSLVQPVLWLFVLGTGLGSLINRGPAVGVDYRTFVYPGVISMTVITTAMFSAASIVWDREFGFLREMLVAPVSRGAIVIGKILGGALVATSQGVIILALAGLVHVPYSPSLILTLLGEMFLASLAITAFGVSLTAKIKNMQSFFGIMQMAIMPMIFLSGAMFPLSNLPGWLAVLTKINPLTYAVDPLRHAIFGHLSVSPQVVAQLNPGVSWFGWHVPVGLEIGLVAVIGVILTAFAIAQFRRTE
ncbi:ABC transporter permease [Streptosporangiaceae bacterium NEAU-GS5]|nr:ABC transporter permease [Streptosporangiaceae bacterium NEAU-GS5]